METPKDVCPVCLDDDDDSDSRKSEEKLDRLVSCGHWIHRKCMDEWIQNGGDTCPMCRGADIRFEEEEESNGSQDKEKIPRFFSMIASPDETILESSREYPRLHDAESWDDIPPSFWTSNIIFATPPLTQGSILDILTAPETLHATEAVIAQDNQESRGERMQLRERYGILLNQISEENPFILPDHYREEDETSNVAKNDMSSAQGVQEDIPEVD